MVTVGYGDITPHSIPEVIVTILVFVLGILFFGILLGSISDMLQRASQAARRCLLWAPELCMMIWSGLSPWDHASLACCPSPLQHVTASLLPDDLRLCMRHGLGCAVKTMSSAIRCHQPTA